MPEAPRASAGPVLEVHGLKVSYGNVEALHGIDLTVASGEIVTILGANGAGKSTTLRAISGLIRPTAGEIRYQGRSSHATPAHELVRLGIAHAPEGRRLFGTLTVAENLMLGAFARRDRQAIATTEDWVLGLFPALRERLEQLAGTLSGGEQQMLAIARALMAEPRVLLLDEPSLGLAPLVVRTIFRTIREINTTRGVTIVLVEQNARAALRLAHRGYVLEVGRVVLADAAAALAANPRVQRAYLGGRTG
ncbi:MAG TPA: ABC transporter ATP-binding protein [Anaeromyxobacter sp.]|nr:ABC transporter ATP-binding protein [Anaeromyxobacter sp.]